MHLVHTTTNFVLGVNFNIKTRNKASLQESPETASTQEGAQKEQGFGPEGV